MITMFDAIDVSRLPDGTGYAYAGYVNGRWPTYNAVRTRFPSAHVLSVAVTAANDADCLDIEQYDASPADAPIWVSRQISRGSDRPCLYASASVMGQVLQALSSGGIARSQVRLWSAHYAGEHICGPGTCNQMSVDADGTQWTSTAMGRSLDQSLLLDSFFGSSPVPAPAPGWQEAMMNKLPTLSQGSADRPGETWFVHRLQALAAEVGKINQLPAASLVADDGVYGPATKSGIQAIQAHYHITADGITGPQTWGVLVTGAA